MSDSVLASAPASAAKSRRAAPRKLMRKILLYPSARFAGRFLKSVIRPSTIAVLITAVVGPLSIKWTTDEIEQKKLQSHVIEEVMRYTDEANFNDASEIMRAGMIASMVNENQKVFGLSLVRAEALFEELSKTLRLDDIASLQTENQRFSGELSGLRARVGADSAKLMSLALDTARIGTRLRQDASLTAAQRQQLEVQLRDHRSTIQRIERERSDALQRIGGLHAELASNQAQLSNANARLAEVERDFQANTAALNAARTEVQQLGTNAVSLRQALDTATARWERATTQASAFRQQVESERQRADLLAQRIDSLTNALTVLERNSERVATNNPTDAP